MTLQSCTNKHSINSDSVLVLRLNVGVMWGIYQQYSRDTSLTT